MILEVEAAKKDKTGVSELMKRKRQRDGKVIRQQEAKKRATAGAELYGHREGDAARAGAGAGAPASRFDSDDDDGSDGEEVKPAVVPDYLKRALNAPKKAKASSFKDESHFITAEPDPSKSDVRLPCSRCVSSVFMTQ